MFPRVSRITQDKILRPRDRYARGVELIHVITKATGLGEHSQTDMKTASKTKLIILSALLSAISLQPVAFAQGTAFTYQGRLNVAGAPANGLAASALSRVLRLTELPVRLS
jgi:hypothetical protein